MSRPTFTTGIVLAVFQLSASLTLLVGAVLLVATLRHLAAVDLGFVPSNVWAFEVTPGSVGYSEERAFAYYQEFSNRLSRNAGVASMAMASSGPLFMATRLTTRLRRYGDFTDQSLHAPYEHLVLSPAYFETLSIRLVRGRDFSQADMGAPGRAAAPVVVLSESLALSLFGTIEVIGESVEFPTLARKDQRHEVIGVVDDVHQFDIAEDSTPTRLRSPGLKGAHPDQRDDADPNACPARYDRGSQSSGCITECIAANRGRDPIDRRREKRQSRVGRPGEVDRFRCGGC